MKVHYQDLPKPIQDLVDGAEFLSKVEKLNMENKTVYALVYVDSFETWTRYYDRNGNQLAESPFLARED